MDDLEDRYREEYEEPMADYFSPGDKMKPDNRLIQAALKDFHEMNTEKQWARLIVGDYTIRVKYGTIHSNGQIERAIGEFTYNFADGNGTIFKLRRHIFG